MLGLRWQQSLVIDESSLLLDPIVPAVDARVGEDQRPKPTRQRRLGESRLALATAVADHLTHFRSIIRCGSSREVRQLTRWEAEIHRLHVVEVASFDDALLDQPLQDSPAVPSIEAKLVRKRLDRFGNAGRRVDKIANTSFVRL